MKEIQEKVKELKLKALKIIDEKLNCNVQTHEMRGLIECLNAISEDKNWYSDALNAGFAGIGFGSIGNNSEKKTPEVSECEK